ncbi:hypothetical protein BsIDN1_63650 [Bacillus safensis]|uniref:Uncharacterized protein n=1 Tax=Bacillus safensis TaxID=561879 RepID=A0A5S9MH00_BACIA|nr:hypothetical protein BsIDN1_63650 [Bacillus safensis]
MKWKGMLIGGCALVGLMFMSQTAVSAQTPSLLEQAEKLIGTPYHKGGTDPKRALMHLGLFNMCTRHPKHLICRGR